MGLSLSIFIIVFIIGLGIWIWTLVVLIKYWKILPSWARVLGVIGILPIITGGVIVTLLAVYIGKHS